MNTIQKIHNRVELLQHFTQLQKIHTILQRFIKPFNILEALRNFTKHKQNHNPTFFHNYTQFYHSLGNATKLYKTVRNFHNTLQDSTKTTSQNCTQLDTLFYTSLQHFYTRGAILYESLHNYAKL